MKKNKIVNIDKNVKEIPQKEEKKNEIKIEENKNKINNEDDKILIKKEENKNQINNENKNELKNEENKNELNNEDKNEIRNKENKNEINNDQPKEKNLNIKQIEVIDETDLNNVHFYEVLYYDENRKIDIYHLILAKENSEAGEVFNNYTYKFIENIYNTVTDIKKPVLSAELAYHLRIIQNACGGFINIDKQS